jgi:hypothetical protein
MLIHVCVVTRNKAITITTLHMLLQLSGKCYQTPDHQLSIHFVDSTKMIPKLIKTSDKILWVDYGFSLDVESFDRIFDTKTDVLIFPAVKEGINWDRFRKQVLANSQEPIQQVGLEFDTELDKKVSDYLWSVRKTIPSIFLIDSKAVDKKMRTKKGEGIKLPRDIDLIFEKFQENDVKMLAYTKANIVAHFTHECVGNILEANGVSCQQAT